MSGEASEVTAPTGSHLTGGPSDRLPTNIKPIHYILTLAPNLKTFTLSGSVEILLKVVQESTSITLNSLNLTIQNPRVECAGRTIDVRSVNHDEENQTVEILLAELLPAGQEARLVLDFDGRLSEEDNVGIYLARYKHRDGSEHHAMISQMQPIDCRRAFPCFDEPALKATFEVTMIADKALTCLSNMDVKHVEDQGPDLNRWVFNTTPPISTYILAFAAGDFDVIEDTSSFRIPVRVYITPNNNVENTQFTLQFGIETLRFFEEKFGLSYPLPKLDMLGSSHFYGAMENWGLVIFEDKYITVTKRTSDVTNIEMNVLIVQHELAHQWFGNLVTMEYWDGLWLNESFATWAALYGADFFYPEWKLWQLNLADEYDKAFKMDSLRSSHPVEVPVTRSSDINQIFDAISYSKGSCVLRMITKYIGENAFLEGTRHYLKKHEYGSTTTNDLWDALTQASGKDIRKFGDAWTRQVGHPILTVTEGDDWIQIRQNRFLRTGDVKDPDDTALYPIFLGLRTSDGVDEDLTFDQRQITIPKTDDFFKVNADHVGLYRTLYQPQRLDKLVARRSQLTPEDRFSLINDAVALATSGHQKTTRALQLIEQFSEDSEYIVWAGIVDAISKIRLAWVFEDDEVQRALALHQRRVVSAKVHELGWTIHETDSHITQRFKSLLFEAAISAGDEEAVEAALQMWTKARARGAQWDIEPNIASAVYVAAVRYGDDTEATYECLFERARTVATSSAKRFALTALGAARDPKLMERTLRLILSDEIPESMMEKPLFELCQFEEGLRASIKWLRENFEAIHKRMGVGMQRLDMIFAPIVGGIASGQVLEEVEEFFKTRSIEAYRRLLEQEFDEARVKIGWVNRDREDVRQWLSAEGSR